MTVLAALWRRWCAWRKVRSVGRRSPEQSPATSVEPDLPIEDRSEPELDLVARVEELVDVDPQPVTAFPPPRRCTAPGCGTVLVAREARRRCALCRAKGEP